MTLVLYPNTRGIGFVLCESEQEIIDFGIKHINRRTHGEYIKNAKWLLDYATPDLVLLLDYQGAVHTISKRQVNIIDTMVKHAKERGLNVKRYSRRQIKDVFSNYAAFSKYDIAKQLISSYPQLITRIPHKRDRYLPEHHQMGVFDAFALMVTHYYLS